MSMRALLASIVRSEPFRFRRGEVNAVSQERCR